VVSKKGPMHAEVTGAPPALVHVIDNEPVAADNQNERVSEYPCQLRRR
jgi:hypothetical protein